METKVEVGRIYIGLPKNIVLEDIYIEDRQKDTLLSGGKIKADINIWRLVTHKEVIIKSIALNNITAKIKRQLPDTSFNFQFIIDAFAPPETTAANPVDSSSSTIDIRSIELNKIRFIYKDVITGSDMEASLEHLDTHIDKFDPEHLRFDIPATNISGLIARIYQSKPLATPEPAAKDMAEAKQPIALQFNFKELNLSNAKLDYRNEVSAMYTTLDIGALNIKPNNLDFTRRIIDLQNIYLENTIAAIRLGKKEQAKVVVEEAKQEVKSQAEAGWRFSIGSLDLTDNTLQFDNDNNPRVGNGMDYGHLKAAGLTFRANDLLFSPDSIAGKISKAEFKEQSGFVLNKLSTEFLYSSNETYFKDLYLQTPGSELKRSALIRYASVESLQHDLGNLFLDLDIKDSKFLVRDILTFVPALRQQPAFAHPDATWYINSRMKGRLADLKIDALQIQGLRDTKIDVSGRIAGLPTMNKMVADLDIRNISSSRRDMDLFIPKNSLPSNITLPSRLNAKGNIKTISGQLNTDLAIATDLGNATIKGSFNEINDPKKLGYNAKIETKALDLGTILQQKEILGPVSATITTKGKGFDPKTASATFEGIVHSALVKQYNYHDLRLKGNIAEQKANINAAIADPNIHFALDASADFSAEYPAFRLAGMIDSIKMQALHLTKDQMIYRGKVEGNFPITNPDNLQGKLFLSQNLFIQNGKRFQLDTVELLAGRSGNGQYLQLNSNIMSAKLEGKYKTTELGNILQQAIEPYFATGATGSIAGKSPYDFTLNAYISDNPALKVLIPGLDKIDSVSFQSHFSDQNGWNALLKAPVVDMGANKIRNLELRAGTNQNALDIIATVKQFTSGKSIELDNTTITAKLADNTIDFTVNSKDKSLKDKYNIKGLLRQPQNGDYQFSIKPDSLMLNYDTWNISASNRITITQQGINASNFVLSKNGQQLSINSISSASNAPVEVNFDQFRLATLTGFVQTDSALANGTLNGKISFKELTNEPVFTGDLSINDLSIKGDTVGNVKILVNNRIANTYAADVTLSGRGNNVKLSGNYYLKTGHSNFDVDLDIKELPLTTAQAFSDNMIRDATGFVNGKFDVTGTLTRPLVKGDLNFNKAGFNFSMLNSYFTIDQERINVDEQGLRFDQFEIKDSAQNSLRINGLAATSNFTNYKFDLDIRANNFRALNSSKKDNKIFYGQLYFNTNLKVKGTEAAPAIDGRLVVNDKTKLTVVLPQKEPGIADREGIVEFVDMNAPLNDSLFMVDYDSLNTSSFTGMDIAVNIEIDPDAELNLVIDEGNGDFLNVKGEASLTAGIDPSGKINLAGSYELNQGSYELTFNFIRRKFDIEKGSRIIWEGEPTKATVDIKAKYVANAAPLDLVKNQLEESSALQRNTYLQKLPFDVHLNMEGELLKPEISFDIILPEEKKYAVSGEIITTVRTRLDQLRQEPGEMNKQVFSLLLLNRFTAENPFNSSGAGFNAGVLARQSVSKLLTEQLNRLADDLVAGVDLNFDVLSSEDYTTGERRDRTDLNVGLSKKLLNDRLTVSVGSNFELEGPRNSNQQSSNIAGNVALDYQVSRDNRYLLRAYRKNEYQGVLDGYIIETGVGFIITVDYNRFKEIFISKRERDQRRLRREQQRKIDEEQKTKSAVDSSQAIN
ncbi:MAG: translocation/assembly module TamB domain-containing protein [Chitinophagaceae bacterium]